MVNASRGWSVARIEGWRSEAAHFCPLGGAGGTPALRWGGKRRIGGENAQKWVSAYRLISLGTALYRIIPLGGKKIFCR
jgi:hypothetical protein